jgi:hypothetical protein
VPGELHFLCQQFMALRILTQISGDLVKTRSLRWFRDITQTLAIRSLPSETLICCSGSTGAAIRHQPVSAAFTRPESV